MRTENKHPLGDQRIAERIVYLTKMTTTNRTGVAKSKLDQFREDLSAFTELQDRRDLDNLHDELVEVLREAYRAQPGYVLGDRIKAVLAKVNQ